MIDPRAKFEAALAAYAIQGNRWSGSKQLTYWAAACGMNTEAVIEAAHGVGVVSRDSDANIRRSMVTAIAKVTANAAKFSNNSSGVSVRRYIRTKPLKPKQPTDRVRRLIELGKDITTMEALRDLSPAEIYAGKDAHTRFAQTAIHLQLLFGLDDIVSLRHNKNDNTPATPNINLRPMRDWLLPTSKVGEIVRPNPLTGKQGKTTGGKPSFGAKDCIAAFRHMIFEFDEMPIADQCRFWAGFIRNGKLPLISLTYSGGKSIHGVIRVNAPDAETWARYRAKIIERYASDTDPRFRLDTQALNPLTGCRLAGIIRHDTGKVQELLFDCGELFEPITPLDDEPLTPNQQSFAYQIAVAQGTPFYFQPTTNKTTSQFTAQCAMCASIDDCKTAFGSFWDIRSSGGVGCHHPFSGWKTTAQKPTHSTTQKLFTL